jgi:hypothetical protein
MSAPRTPKSDKELWQSLALEQGPGPVAISDNDFAAWLEGRLPEIECARVEAAVSRDPALRAAAMDLADILGKPLPTPPAKMMVRAQGLVGSGAGGSSSGRGSWWPGALLAGLLPSFDSGFSLQRGVMAGAAVIVAAVGFLMGGGLGTSFVERKYASAQSPAAVSRSLGSDTTQQLNDLFTDNI